MVKLVDFSNKRYLEEQDLQRWLALPGNMPLKHFRETEYFGVCGGRLMEHVIFQAMIDSLQKTIEIPPMVTEGNRDTRRKRRYNARRENETSEEARRWVRNEMPTLWKGVFNHGCDRILEWLEEAWKTIDAHPEAAPGYRRMVQGALIEREPDEQRPT